jgi:hypothetical protein
LKKEGEKAQPSDLLTARGHPAFHFPKDDRLRCPEAPAQPHRECNRSEALGHWHNAHAWIIGMIRFAHYGEPDVPSRFASRDKTGLGGSEFLQSFASFLQRFVSLAKAKAKLLFAVL